MQITNEKSQIDGVMEAHLRASGHETEHKDRYSNAFEIYSCFRKFETATFDTQGPDVQYLISFTTSIPYDNLCKVVESGVNYPQSAEHNFLNLKPELTEIGLQIVAGWAVEHCFCPLVREDWN
jgi:hypothetical protein